MADRLQPRRDTAARWAAVNPVLLEGEWGVVTDNPAYYKIGDGVTAWNDLPLRGYDGTLVQTTGHGTQTVMSQDATTKALAAQKNYTDTKAMEAANNLTATEERIDGELGELRQDVADFKQEVADNYAKQDGEYKELTAGFAYDIVGDGQATEEQFSFRPTAGVNRNVKTDGAAQIKTLKGNSVVWNQLVNTDTTSVELTANHRYITNIGGTISLQSPTSATTINVSGDTDKVTDLTKMFGAGNEPTTVEEFYQRLPKVVDINANNEGEIVDGNYGAIKTTGVNQWDEQWETGSLDTSNGALIPYASRIRTKNYISIVGGAKYYANYNGLVWCFYDSNKQFISSASTPQYPYSVPQNARYALFRFSSDYGPTYKNDICISLVWPEYDQFTDYEPYKPHVRDLSEIVSKYFPNGMRSAGSARDEIRFNSSTQKWEAVQRVGVLTLSAEKVFMSTAGSFKIYSSRAPLKDIAVVKEGYMNLLCGKYTTINDPSSIYTGVSPDKVISINSNGSLYARDTAYTNSTSFEEAINGLEVYYELAEPIVTEITENVNFAFDVSDRGTEELVVAEGVQSAPIVADIVYQPNVLATIKNVPDLAAQVAALQAQVASMAAAMATTNVTEEE